MKTIDQKSVDLAFESGNVENVTVCKLSKKQWYFTFEVREPVTGKICSFAMETQRGGLRTWADPRVLFEFLEERGINNGNFILNED